MTVRLHLLGLVAFLACWFALAGGGGCGSPSEQPTIASASVNTYQTPPWIDASGVIWTPSYSATGFGVKITGAGERYIYAGGIDGPLPLAAVYECSSSGCPAGTSKHCPGGDSNTCGTCPVPCFEYHRREGYAHAVTGRSSYRETCVRDEGDGISAETFGTSSWAGEIEVLRSAFRSIHDDAVEHDGCRSMSVKDTMIDGAFMGFAMKPREQDPEDCTASTIELDRVLVRLLRFTNAYEQKPGHGGVFKLDDGNLPWFIVRDSVFFVGPVPGDGQHYLPPPSRTDALSCEGNTLLFAGDSAQRAAWLADEDGADGLTNQEKLDALAYCYTLTYRQPSQNYGDFLLTEWLPRSVSWQESHQAGGGC